MKIMETYEKPNMEIIEVDMEACMLQASSTLYLNDDEADYDSDGL